MLIKKFFKTLIPTALAVSMCLNPSLTSICSAEAATDDDVIRVMPLGDSITDGYWLTGGYRTTLCDLLEQNGYSQQFDFVGPNWGGDCYDPQHAGYSGYSIDNIDQTDSISGARTGISSFIDWLMESYPADVVMLQIGTNDILSYYDLDNITLRLQSLADKILQHLDDDGMLYIATIPCMDANDNLYISSDYFTPDSMDAIIDNYNSQIKLLVAELQNQGKNVALADINSVVSKSDLFDGVHPNADGYSKMGQYWYSKLLDYLQGNDDVIVEPIPIDGDADQNGILNHLDLYLYKKFLLSHPDNTNPANSDLYQDGKLNAFDIILLKRKL